MHKHRSGQCCHLGVGVANLQDTVAFKLYNDERAFYLFIFSKFIYLFIIYFWLCWVFVAARAFSSCGEQGLPCIAVRGLLIAVTGESRGI